MINSIFYLYEGEFLLPDACFGLMADKEPSKAYFYTDIVRFAISYFFLLFAFSTILFEWIEKKYLDKKLSINQWIGNFYSSGSSFSLYIKMFSKSIWTV